MGDNKWGVEIRQNLILEKLEQLTGKSIPLVNEIKQNTVGVKVEGKRVIGLGLCKCDLTNLPEIFGQLQSLRDLKLIENQLTTLPEPIIELKSLQMLDLDANELTNLPEVFGQLRSLRDLKLNDNQLTTLPESIFELKSLQTLHVGANRLITLPDSFTSSQPLQKIRLDSNKLMSLPESFGNLTSLQNLDLSVNQLTTLPESFSQLYSLRELDLSYNQLISLPDSFGELRSLQRLDLSHNNLTRLPASFWRLQNLTYFHIGDIKEQPFEDKLAELLRENVDLDGLFTNISILLDYLRKIAGINVFVSYAVSDFDMKRYPIAELATYLTDCEEIYYAFHCKQDMEKEGHIDKFMNETIPECQILLFIATTQSLRPESDCLHELALARSLGIKVIPILGDIGWDNERLIMLELNREFGLRFEDLSFEKLCEKLYQSIYEYKREHNVFEREEAELEEKIEFLRNMFEKFIESSETKKIIKIHLDDLRQLNHLAGQKQISPWEYIFQYMQILSRKS